jgi:hypothetical protein
MGEQVMHAYVQDAQSGAGNCTCGAAREHRRHPHEFRRARNFPGCVCGDPAHREERWQELDRMARAYIDGAITADEFFAWVRED